MFNCHIILWLFFVSVYILQLRRKTYFPLIEPASCFERLNFCHLVEYLESQSDNIFKFYLFYKLHILFKGNILSTFAVLLYFILSKILYTITSDFHSCLFYVKFITRLILFEKNKSFNLIIVLYPSIKTNDS